MNTVEKSYDILIVFRFEYFPPTVVSPPEMEFIMACNRALDAEVSVDNALSPSDALRIAVAWAAFNPTMSRFSVNTVNCCPASFNVAR